MAKLELRKVLQAVVYTLKANYPVWGGTTCWGLPERELLQLPGEAHEIHVEDSYYTLLAIVLCCAAAILLSQLLVSGGLCRCLKPGVFVGPILPLTALQSPLGCF